MNRIVAFAVIIVWGVIINIIINTVIRRVDVKVFTDTRRIYIIVVIIRTTELLIAELLLSILVLFI